MLADWKKVGSVGKASVARHCRRVIGGATLARRRRWDIVGIDFLLTNSWPMTVADKQLSVCSVSLIMRRCQFVKDNLAWVFVIE